MSKEPGAVPLGTALDRAYQIALREWCKKHSARRPYDVALQEDITQMQLTFDRQLRRPSIAYVQIVCSDPWKCETYAIRILMHGWKHADSTVQLLT